jgi:Na+/H+-dicarboxylate symporter
VNSARIGQYYGAIGRRIALQHPVGLTLVVFRGIFTNLFDSDWQSLMVVSEVPSTVIEIAMNATVPLVIAVAAIGVLALRRRDALFGTLLAATIVYFILLSAGSEAEARFRVPVMPQIAIAAGVGVEAIRRGIREMVHAA